MGVLQGLDQVGAAGQVDESGVDGIHAGAGHEADIACAGHVFSPGRRSACPLPVES